MLQSFGVGKDRSFCCPGALTFLKKKSSPNGQPNPFKLVVEAVVQESSGPFPRLDRWLAAELIEGLMQLPELQFKVQGYIEGCTRDAIAPRGRAILHMIFPSFWFGSSQGSPPDFQSVFRLSCQVLLSRTFKSFRPDHENVWTPSHLKIGPIRGCLVSFCSTSFALFVGLRGSGMRSRDPQKILAWETLTTFGAFARVFGWRTWRCKCQIHRTFAEKPKEVSFLEGWNTFCACESCARDTIRCCCCSRNSGSAESRCKESWRAISGTGRPMTPAEKAKTPCIFHQIPPGCIHGANCQYDHTEAPPPKKSEPDAKSRSKAASVPKVPAAVAIIAALSSMISPSQSFGTLKWCADTGAGRHMISYEVLSGQGFQYDTSSFRQVVVRSALPRQLDWEIILVSLAMQTISFLNLVHWFVLLDLMLKRVDLVLVGCRTHFHILSGILPSVTSHVMN